jgi:tripartite-type tricarboxylate transporter receptor subunit TctC
MCDLLVTCVHHALGGSMKLPHRRQFLHLAAGAVAVPALPRDARAQTYPSRPVRIIVAFAAGGTGDILARLIGQWLSERLGQPFVIENRPGAGSNIATELVVNSPQDGYTLLLVSTSAGINATLYDKLSFNFIRDVTPVVGLVRAPNVLVVHPAFPAKTVPEFIAYVKANPGVVKMGKVRTGQSPHMSAELFRMMTGLECAYMPFGSTPAMLSALVGGEVQFAFDSLPSSIPHIKAGSLRALAVSTTIRSETMPEVPTLGDFVPGYEASGWFGLGAPRNTPAEVVDKLNAEVSAAFRDSEMNAKLLGLGGMPLVGSPNEFGKLIADETEKWSKVVKFAGVKPD